ncbi:MAG: D-glycero-beta-D-manno-heptose 1-phosphate adenylyltransferase [Bacteroidota bacterium]
MQAIEQVKQKIHTWDSLKLQVQEWRKGDTKVVFTNGCFDLIHYGHLHYLAEARDLGTHLIVGLNGSASVSRLKGPHRPINDDDTRLHAMASFQFVDAVTTFDQDTPLELIQSILPDVLVKGGDWAIDSIVGSDVVLANGGTVKSLAFIPGYSTTSIEQKIRSW